MFWFWLIVFFSFIAEANHQQPLIKYWIALLVCFMVFNLPNYLAYPLWFFLGASGMKIISRPVRSTGSWDLSKYTNNGVISTSSVLNELNKSYQKFEGWMLTYPLEFQNYSPASHNQKNINGVFIQINGQRLTLSFPYPKHKIPRRKTCDEKFKFDTQKYEMFAQHAEYDLRGAEIEMVPIELNQKRVWRKKYPISISLALSSVDNKWNKIHYYPALMKKSENGRKLFLFARTDREKDDWYRRLVFASKTTAASPFQTTVCFNKELDLVSFVEFMRTVCPNLRSSSNWMHNRLMTPSFLNMLIGRCVYHLLMSSDWKNKIRAFIDTKLSTRRKPAFVELILVKELDLGTCAPKLVSASEPVMDSQGLWVDLEMEYSGKILISIDVLLKAKSDPKLPQTQQLEKFDLDAEDSDDSSEFEWLDEVAKTGVGKWIVESIAGAPILLTMEIKRVLGVLAVNFPLVPSDRVWIGFRSKPVVEFEVRPEYGEWALDFSLLTGFIKKKLLLELQRTIVYPNMIDIILDRTES